jgi:tartrate-resistant acid phosphatase type 5
MLKEYSNKSLCISARETMKYGNNANFVLSGTAGSPQLVDCNYGVSLGPYVKFLGANSEATANGFVTMDIGSKELVFEYMQYDGGDLDPIQNDIKPSDSLTATEHVT